MNRRADGTTLVELVIALAVSSIILSAGYAMADQLVRTTPDDAATQATLKAAELRRTLSSWFGNALTELDGTLYPFTGTSAPTARIQALLASAPPYTPREVIATLFVDDDARTSEEGLIVTLADPLDRTSQSIELDRDVAAMKILYLIRSDSGAAWTEVYTSSFEPPRAIRITLEPREGARLHRLLELPLIVPVGLQ